uniref:Gustatory receptor n=1 Tax=Anopheles albimanus TaxID=7167 RepID=A0A1Y9G893_ANOAL
MWVDWIAVGSVFNTTSPVMLGLVCIDVCAYSMLVFCLAFNSFLHRKRFIQLLNGLFVQQEFTLDWPMANNVSNRNKQGSNLHILVGLALLYTFFNIATFPHTQFRKLNAVILVRVTVLFLTLDLYRVCTGIIRMRMQQLQAMVSGRYSSSDTEQHWERKLSTFFDRFQHYYQQIALVNQCFSVPLLNIFMLLLVELTFTCYEYYQMNDNVTYDPDAGIYVFLMRQMMQLVFAGMVVMFGVAGHSTKVQVEETARCTRYFDDYRLQNTRAAKQVQKFLLKNLHQKKKFSACGFFDIDNTVIYMVFSSIVTYLVILIQFKQLENDLTQPVPYNGTANGTTEAP